MLRLKQPPESNPVPFQAQIMMCRSSTPFPSTCRVCAGQGGSSSRAGSRNALDQCRQNHQSFVLRPLRLVL